MRLKRSHFIGVFVLIIVVYFLFYFIRESQIIEWENEIKPTTDEFIHLLKKGDFGVIYSKYGNESEMSQDQFVNKFLNAKLKYNNYNSIEYKGVSGSNGSFYVHYTLFTKEQKEYSLIFTLQPDKDKKRPLMGKIFHISITGDFGKDSFDLRLIKK